MEEIGREGVAWVPLCRGIIVVLGVELCQAIDSDTMMLDTSV